MSGLRLVKNGKPVRWSGPEVEAYIRERSADEDLEVLEKDERITELLSEAAAIFVVIVLLAVVLTW